MAVMTREHGRATAKWFSKGKRYQCAAPGCGFETDGPKAFGEHHADHPDHRTPAQAKKYYDNVRQRQAKQSLSEDSEISKFKKIMGPKALSRKGRKARKAHGTKVARSRNPVIQDMDMDAEIYSDSYVEEAPTGKKRGKYKMKGRSLRNSSNRSQNHKFCTQCGGPRTGSWTFCAHCGRKLA